MATRRKSGPDRKKPLNRFGEDVTRELKASPDFATLEALAKAAGTTYRTLYGYMTAGGTTKIPAAIVEGIRDALGVPADRIRVTAPPQETLERDSDQGYPGFVAFRLKHPDTKPEYLRELRLMAAKIGPEHFTLEGCERLVASFKARDAGKLKQRPELTDDDS